jgi:ABC-type multidrug transport system ATPase subunit
MTQTTVLAPVAQADSLVTTYGSGENTVAALRGVSASFARGRFTAIMGPSGSGKSTFLHCLSEQGAGGGRRGWLKVEREQHDVGHESGRGERGPCLGVAGSVGYVSTGPGLAR